LRYPARGPDMVNATMIWRTCRAGYFSSGTLTGKLLT
jgi:hypothetical protein